MCNNILTNKELYPRKIKSEGFGYKLFTIVKDTPISLVNLNYYSVERDDWINYYAGYTSSGFCFFISLKEARRALPLWLLRAAPLVKDIAIKRIEYKNGIQSRREYGFIGRECFRIALCKSFKIIS